MASEDSASSRVKLGRSDVRRAIVIAALGFLLHVYGLGELHFFRHTEADRTLIAWEMAETGDWMIPRLLGSTILTKPPLYYWLVAASISFFGEASEWVARMPSVLLASVFVLLQYLFSRRAGCSVLFSTLSAGFLATSLQFFILATVAEIDMMFGLLCAVTLYAGYFAASERSVPWLLAAYAAAVPAFLTKGPPVLFFFVASQLLFLLSERCEGVSGRTAGLRGLAVAHGAGMLLFLSGISLWIFPLAGIVGWRVLGGQLQVEIFERILYESARERGPFFYLWSTLGGLVPWSIFLVAAACCWAAASRARTLKDAAFGLYAEGPPAFFRYSVITVVAAIMMLSLAQGKSSRYLFPIHAFCVQLAVYAALWLRGSTAEARLFRLGAVGAPAAAVIVLALPFFLSFEGISTGDLLIGAIWICLPMIALTLACRQSSRIGTVVALMLFMVSLRVGQHVVYTPHRNHTRSVAAAAERIHAFLPKGHSVYTVELFERWISYYLKRLGRQSLRVTPAIVEDLANKPGTSYLLLSSEDEWWRLAQLQLYDAETAIAAEFEAGKDRYLLIRASAPLLRYLEPASAFPTVPSRPFHFELERYYRAPRS